MKEYSTPKITLFFLTVILILGLIFIHHRQQKIKRVVEYQTRQIKDLELRKEKLQTKINYLK